MRHCFAPLPDPTLESALHGAPPSRRAALFAQAGFWYDAVAAAADMEAFDRHAALDALMNEVGLVEPARYDRQTDGPQGTIAVAPWDERNAKTEPTLPGNKDRDPRSRCRRGRGAAPSRNRILQ